MPVLVGLVLGVLGAARFEASQERNLETRMERAGVEGFAGVCPCGGSGVALEVGRELVAAETRRGRARLNSGLIVNRSVPSGYLRMKRNRITSTPTRFPVIEQLL